MCGLAGFINAKQRRFDYSAFCTLGIANDVRGGDSCGIFIDGRYEYGTGKEKFFSDFFLDSKLLAETTRAKIALLHCRKASIGGIGEGTAQPVVINGEYVLMHNGTITNSTELAAKYLPGMDTLQMTDSQVMAHIFYHKGYDALKEYMGSGVFVIADYRSGDVLFFKGESKENGRLEEERPLYGCLTGDELIFSSIPTHLYALRRNAQVCSFPGNSLVRYAGDRFKVVRTYDRSTLEQRTVWYGWNDLYIECDYWSNKYSLDGKALNKPYFLTEYGRVDNKAGKLHYFFHGTWVRGYKSWDFLRTLAGRYKRDDFDKRYKNLMYYLSQNPVYFDNGLWYKAVSPTGRETYSGPFQMLTTSVMWMIENGRKTTTTYGAPPKVDNDDSWIDFEELGKICGSLTR